MSWRALVAMLLTCSGVASAASLSLDRGPIILGRTESVGVTLRLDETPGTEERPLRVNASVGHFTELTRVKPGVYRTTYVPPSTRFPQLVLVAVWQETGPDAPIDFLRIPLYGLATLSVTARPRAQVTIRTPDGDYGPVTADAKGVAKIAAPVAPGVRQVEAISREAGSDEGKRVVEVVVPPYNRLIANLVPHAIVADGQQWARLELFYELGGAQVAPDRIRVKPSIGRLSFERAERGRYVYRYLPPAGAPEKEVTFSVSVEGDPAAAATARLSLGLPPAARVVIRPPSQSLAADGVSRAAVSVIVQDSTGLGLPGQEVGLRANGVPVGGLSHIGGGVYEAQFTAPADYPSAGLVTFEASAGSDPARVVARSNYQLKPAPVPKSVAARFEPDPLPADGRSEGRVVLAVKDGAGMPMKGARLIAVPSVGTLGPLTPVGEGLYEAAYVAPERAIAESELRIVDTSGAFESRVAIPLRVAPGRLLAGLRAGVSHSLQSAAMFRVGVDLWAPLRLRGSYFGVALSATYASLSQSLSDEAGELTTRVEARLVPVVLRAGYEVFASRRWSLTVGPCALLTYAQVRDSASGTVLNRWGGGGGAFLALGAALGPGQAFVELSAGFAPLEASLFRLQSAGLGLELGYRFGVL